LGEGEMIPQNGNKPGKIFLLYQVQAYIKSGLWEVMRKVKEEKEYRKIHYWRIQDNEKVLLRG
jgi:hypothetical protein